VNYIKAKNTKQQLNRRIRINFENYQGSKYFLFIFASVIDPAVKKSGASPTIGGKAKPSSGKLGIEALMALDDEAFMKVNKSQYI
jgi:hypothetical protein